MEYIKVLAIDSTNSELKRRYRNNVSLPNLCLSAEEQTSGRGQRENAWLTEKGKNLTFSLLLNDLKLETREAFKISALVSLAILDFLNRKFPLQDFYIKWPNDIMAGQEKLTGILIENMIRGQKIKASIIGIGLNVNQVYFESLPKATSLKKISQTDQDLPSLLRELSSAIEQKIYESISLDEILKLYNQQLFRKGEVSQFEFPDKTREEGSIRRVTSVGNLLVQFSSGIKEFRFKEVKLIY